MIDSQSGLGHGALDGLDSTGTVATRTALRAPCKILPVPVPIAVLLIVTRLRETSVKLKGSEKLYKTKTVVQKISDLY